MDFIRTKKLFLFIGGVLVLAFLLLFSFNNVKHYFYLRSAASNHSTLRLVTAGLRGELNRFEPLPALIADNSSIKALLENQNDQGLLLRVNEYLKKITIDVGASDIYVMNEQALTIAAGNFDTPISFINRNFSYRPYFQDAIQGRLGRYFALGSTSLKRGYYFAAPIRNQSKILGVAVVKVSIDEFEKAWRGNENEIIVTDEHGIIFMSSQDEWLFQSLSLLSDQLVESIRKSRQYPVTAIKPLKVSITEQLDDKSKFIRLSLGGGLRDFISEPVAMIEAGWTVYILTPTRQANTQFYLTFFSLALLILFGILFFAFLRQRRKILMDRILTQRNAQEQLEERVRSRTADLNAANIKLIDQVEERKLAETQLRQTQQDLIQAGKLAALGQMSAALSHEFNQPLSAMRSYTDNAKAFLERDRIDEVGDNIGRIAELIERMTAISKHLRNFARKPQEQYGAVPLAPVLNDAIEIMSGKLKIKGAKINQTLPQDALMVFGGRIRLQQVFVNLISNALDAMSEISNPIIEITAKPEKVHDDSWVTIEFRDHGDGFSSDVLTKIFDPFFTTKSLNQGLGLGLSISYNIIKDFDGQMTASNHPDGGAVFVIKLKQASYKVEVAKE